MFLGHEDDAIGAAPEIHETVFENDLVRILRIVMPPGHKTVPHWHPKNTGYVIQGDKVRITLPSGETKEAELTPDSIGSGEGMHAVENIGDTTIKMLQVEFKQ